CDTIVRRRFRQELPIEIAGGLALFGIVMAPVFLLGGFQSFLQVLVYRFIGKSSGNGGVCLSLIGQIIKADPSGILPVLPITVMVTCIGYSLERMRSTQPRSILLVKWTLVAALAFSLLSFAEPQWLSWLLPLGILYGSMTGRLGIQYFSYLFGAVSTFLTITLLQGTGYLLIGSGATFLIGYVENVPGGVLLYAVMTTIMIVMFATYSFSNRLRAFRLEVVPLVILLYLQAFFW